MGAIEGRIKEARHDVLLAAATRWREREAPRKQNLSSIARSGVGAGDTPKRQQEWFARERAKAQNKMLFVERVIGPTNDFSPFAPSQLATKAAQPVARIVTLPGDGRVPQGVATGFLIPGNLLLTNFHVFQNRSDANGYGANFNYYEDERGLNAGSYFELDPHSFFISDKDFDFAIVAVKTKGLGGESLAGLGQIRLIEATGKILTGAALNIVQHPNGGPRQFAFTNNRLLDILGTGFLHYETDTDKGSSGSPVCNIDWELVGLHHCGVPKVENGNIMTVNNTIWDDNRQPESDIAWVANECARVSSIVSRLRALTADSPAEQAMLSALLSSTSDPVAVPVAAAERAALGAIGGSMNPPAFNFSGPVTINVYPAAAGIAADLATAAQPAMVSAFSAEEKTLVFDSGYAKRAGYDPLFLGVEIAPPSMESARYEELYSVADYKAYYEDYRNVPRMALGDSKPEEPLVLPYHHYSLAFNKKYRMCHWTASNCDYRELERMDTRKRSALGGENWRYDPRVPEHLQLGNADVYAAAKRLDRGHIVRREDNAWGEAGLPTDYANADTYHWTNCTPQHEAFNRESPHDNRPDSNLYKGVKGIWGEFEGDLASAVEKGGGQAVIFAGPLLDDHFAETDWGKGKVAIPKKFWKVYVVPVSPSKPTRLQVVGYIFSQEKAVNDFGMTYEAVALPQFDRDRASLDKISEMTGIIFAPILKEAELP